MPDWNDDPIEVAEAAKWPLRLLTAPGYFQAHTAFSGVGFLRDREGKPFCILHPEDAATARPQATATRCACSTTAAQIGLMLRVSDEIQPGVVLVPGQRPTGEAVSGTINMLCSDRYTDMGEGATYQSTWLDVGPWKAQQRGRINSLPRHTGEVARRAGGGEPELRSRLIPDLKFSRLPVGLSPSAPFGGTSPV